LKILHILQTPRAEGTPNLVLDWLGTDLHEQEVYVLHKDPADLTDRLRSGAAWYGEARHLDRGKWKFPSIAVGVRTVCLERKPDLVICWTTGFANWVCLGARLAGVRRLIVHCGNPPTRGLKTDWITRYVMWPLALMDAKCVCCSRYVRDEFLSIPFVSRSIFSAVHNCARLDEVSKRAAIARAQRQQVKGSVGIMVATMEAHKDHRTLMHAVPIILKEFPDFRLRLVGDGSLRAQLQDLADSLSLQNAVDFLGTRTDIPELLGQADLFIFSTTVQEGLGSVLIEAMAAGLPIVATSVPACVEALDNGRFGTLVPFADTAALGNAVIKALKCKNFSANIYSEWTGHFTPLSMITQYLSLVRLA